MNNARYDGLGNYIKIRNDYYYEEQDESFATYKFKINRQGGSTSTITFNKLFGFYKIGDSVEYYLNGIKKFLGYIDNIENNGLTLNVVPNWYKLKNQTIQGSLILESTLSVFDAVNSLKEKINDIGITFIDDIDVMYKTYNCTMSFGGRNIADILDDILDACPETTVWGVDIDNVFYFKTFSEVAEKRISWYDNDFTDSEYTRDGSSLVTGYVIRRKQFNTDNTETLPEVVGETLYDPPAFINEIGKRIDLFEYPFSVSDDNVAYAYAYNQLMKQYFIEKTTLKNVNVDLEINEAVKCILKPINNYYRDIDIGINVGAKKVHNYLNNDAVFMIDDIVNEFVGIPKENIVVLTELSLTRVDEYYKRACNESLDVYLIFLEWSAIKEGLQVDSCTIEVTDGNITRLFYSVKNRVNLDVTGMNKRRIIVRSDLETITFTSMRVYFSQGSRVVNQNVIELEYSFKNGILQTNAVLSRLNTKLVSYLFDEQQKVKKLEQLFSDSNI